PPSGARCRRLPRMRPAGGGAGAGRPFVVRCSFVNTLPTVVLIVLLAALGVTILSIGPLIWWHVLLGMLVIPPVLLKLGSAGWRFARYYTGSPEYVRRGPPLLPL